MITQAEFTPGAAATPVPVIRDMRHGRGLRAENHSGSPRFHDMTDFSFNLEILSATECPFTRLDGNRICKEVGDRGLTWRYPFGPVSRRGERLVLWSIMNASN